MYDSYLKNSIKESIRIQRATEMPIKTMNLNLDSSVPLEIKKFWHHQPKKISNYFVNLIFIAEAKEAQKYIVLGGYITSNDDIKE